MVMDVLIAGCWIFGNGQPPSVQSVYHILAFFRSWLADSIRRSSCWWFLCWIFGYLDTFVGCQLSHFLSGQQNLANLSITVRLSNDVRLRLQLRGYIYSHLVTFQIDDLL
jgi:hypothetical protein